MKNLIYVIVFLALFTGCSEEDLGKSLIDTSTPILTETDVWIRSNYTTPFNVEVKYRWDNSELDNTKKLTPPELNRVQPFLDNMKQVWIDPYSRHAGADFVKKYIPKLMVLVGSHNMNSDGSIILGQAEGGRKVTIFDLNYISFDFEGLSDYEIDQLMVVIVRTFRTMHHEFGHILHQTIAYPLEYKKITPNYVRNWMNFSENQARALGFFTSYSMLNPDEDFVEMLSHILTMSNAEWNKTIDKIVVYDENYDEDVKASAAAKSLLRQKEKIIADYMLGTWKINLYDLQADISEVMENIKKSGI